MHLYCIIIHRERQTAERDDVLVTTERFSFFVLLIFWKILTAIELVNHNSRVIVTRPNAFKRFAFIFNNNVSFDWKRISLSDTAPYGAIRITVSKLESLMKINRRTAKIFVVNTNLKNHEKRADQTDSDTPFRERDLL